MFALLFEAQDDTYGFDANAEFVDYMVSSTKVAPKHEPSVPCSYYMLRTLLKTS